MAAIGYDISINADDKDVAKLQKTFDTTAKRADHLEQAIEEFEAAVRGSNGEVKTMQRTFKNADGTTERLNI